MIKLPTVNNGVSTDALRSILKFLHLIASSAVVLALTLYDKLPTVLDSLLNADASAAPMLVLAVPFCASVKFCVRLTDTYVFSIPSISS